MELFESEFEMLYSSLFLLSLFQTCPPPFCPFIVIFCPSFRSLLSSRCLPPEAGYGDSVYRVCGYMCLDSCSQSQADTFKLVFDQQPNSRVSVCACVCVRVYVCMCVCLIYCRQGDRSPRKQASQALGWSVSDAWRKAREKEFQRKERIRGLKHKGKKRKYTKQEFREIFGSLRAPDFTFCLVAYWSPLFFPAVTLY